jgi:hypothetical protein
MKSLNCWFGRVKIKDGSSREMPGILNHHRNYDHIEKSVCTRAPKQGPDVGGVEDNTMCLRKGWMPILPTQPPKACERNISLLLQVGQVIFSFFFQ